MRCVMASHPSTGAICCRAQALIAGLNAVRRLNQSPGGRISLGQFISIEAGMKDASLDHRCSCKANGPDSYGGAFESTADESNNRPSEDDTPRRSPRANLKLTSVIGKRPQGQSARANCYSLAEQSQQKLRSAQWALYRTI